MFCLTIDDTKRATRERVGRPLLAGFMILGVAFCGRIAAACGDLAMDEIWSLGFVEQFVRSIADVFTVRHDNNHLLNTAVMFGLGTELPGVAYRVVPVLLSCLAAWFAGCLSDKATWQVQVGTGTGHESGGASTATSVGHPQGKGGWRTAGAGVRT